MPNAALEQQIREQVLPALRTVVDIPQSDDEFVQACLTIIDDPEQTLPTLELFSFLLNLPRNNATDQEWKLGRHLSNQWFDSVSVVERNGRRETWPDRMVIFCYLEWRVRFFATPSNDAVSHAAKLFNVPEDTLARWYIKKHEYADERQLAEKIIEFVTFAQRSHQTDGRPPE